ncbi:hypothetical protein CDN99_24705 [Roseateles aquatilis]|uniref:SnoaL-like domain-containing protein n=1 Tax=Roseateles aquatilis TaxID=431061 RepID=A0A246IWC1_9BURK|nr:SgcJ/EcaC family oxidoreductase [Roseateles aquatilis]OWQ84089.1 hypothetical protein CDN99_24705 [Roseateles aquatilis]
MSDDPVHAFLRDYAAAVLARDLNAMVDLYAPDVQVFDSWDQWLHDGRDAWASLVKDWFDAIRDERVRLSATDVKSWRDGGAVAGGSALLEFAALDEAGMPLRALQNRLSVILRQHDGRWRVVHQHTSVPVDFNSQQVVRR